VVSALIPVTSIFPGGNDGEGWVSATLLVPSAKSVSLSSLFASPRHGLVVLAMAARTHLLANDSCLRPEILHPIVGGEWGGLAPIASNYKNFALTPAGLTVGFGQGLLGAEACGAPAVTVSWPKIRPLLSAKGHRLISQLRNPIMRSLPPPIAFVQGVDEVVMLEGDLSMRYVTTGDQPQWLPGHSALLVNRSDFTRSLAGSEVWLVRLDGTEKQVTSVYPQQVRFFAVGQRKSTPFIVYDTLRSGIQISHLNGSHIRTVTRHGVVDDLAVSHDGLKVAYVTEATRHEMSGLYVTGLDGTGHHLVRAGNRISTLSSPSWSPDGRWIAFTLSVMKGFGDFFTGIWLIHPDGTDMHLLTAGSGPTWSPDGQWIAYLPASSQQNGPQGIFKIHPDGSERVQILRRASDSSSPGDGAAKLDW
jgi:hypothetical protein